MEFAGFICIRSPAREISCQLSGIDRGRERGFISSTPFACLPKASGLNVPIKPRHSLTCPALWNLRYGRNGR